MADGDDCDHCMLTSSPGKLRNILGWETSDMSGWEIKIHPAASWADEDKANASSGALDTAHRGHQKDPRCGALPHISGMLHVVASADNSFVQYSPLRDAVMLRLPWAPRLGALVLRRRTENSLYIRIV